MPLTVTKLKMWADPKYTRGCLEVPPVGSKKLPPADWESNPQVTFRPEKGSTLTSLKIPLSYTAVFDMSYLYIEASDGYGTVALFGWVDSIVQSSTSAEGVRINWTVDWWRSYLDRAVFGKGTITRCNDATYKRPFATSPRLWTIDKSVKIASTTETFGFILMASETDAQDNITGFVYYWGLLDQTTPSTRTPTLNEMYSGKLDEIIGIAPTAIIGAWIIPGFATVINFFLGTTAESHSYQTDTITFNKSTGIQGVYASIFATSDINDFKSDDMYRCVALDPYGNICSELPWGYNFKSNVNPQFTMDISTNGVTIYIIPNPAGPDERDKALVTGKYLSISGVPIPINSNAWSEYNYTYQREYDKRIAEIQRNQRAISSLSNIGSSVIGGTIGGAMVGGPVGAGVGALAGSASSLIGTGIDYITTGYFNDKLQAETDKLTSNQTSTLLMGGGGLAWKALTGGWRIAQLIADSVSKGEYDQHIALNGYSVEIPVNDPSTFISNGGPLQIINLNITGTIPPQAKQYIKDKLESGVYITENNPSGATP